MEILKKISKDKLIIMVTHNPELAQNYSTRIMRIVDGLITEDSNPIRENEIIENEKDTGIGRTKMSFWTGFRLSLNNLLTKKGRTILVAIAGSIGIIGIALIQAVSTGFQNYVDSIQEDTLESYPLTIMQETTDVTSMLLSMTEKSEKNDNENELKEKQYITTMFANLSTNDLKSFKKYLEKNYNEVKDDISTIKYSYSIDPLIYSIDKSNKLAKLNPSNLYDSMFGGATMFSSYSSYASIYSQMVDDTNSLNESYNMLSGRWPEKYDELVIVLSDEYTISDLLVYSLGLRDTEELATMMTKIMNGESVDVNNEPLTFTYEDLMNIDLRLIEPSNIYRYNARYDIYEDMSEDKEYMQKEYDNGLKLKIVGIVCPKEGINTMALNPGVNYTSGLIDHIIDYSKDSIIVKKQLENPDIDVISGKRFDDEDNNKLGLNFADLVSVDSNMLKNAFNVNISQKDVENKMEEYMKDLANSVTIDTSKAENAFKNGLDKMSNGILNAYGDEITKDNVDEIVNKYLKTSEPIAIMNALEKEYLIPKENLETVYSGLLKGLVQVYADVKSILGPVMNNDNENIIISEETINQLNAIAPELGNRISKIINKINDFDMNNTIVSAYSSSLPIQGTVSTMGAVMTEATLKKEVLAKMGEITADLTKEFASSFNVDQGKFTNAFRLKVTEDEIQRIVSAMMSKTKKSAKTNLVLFGYQDKEEPTYISFYFTSFDGKEHFMKFIDEYNQKMIEAGEEDKEINYTDTTGILMNSVKIIVSAVSYVLIAFVSISLIVSSFMIGIITYISVYERTKEIGILRALGASKHNISSIFNAETFIIGFLSGIFGIGISYTIIPIINAILHHFAGDIPLNATLNPGYAIGLIILSIILTLIGGIIPAKAASKKDPVIALRTE